MAHGGLTIITSGLWWSGTAKAHFPATVATSSQYGGQTRDYTPGIFYEMMECRDDEVWFPKNGKGPRMVWAGSFADVHECEATIMQICDVADDPRAHVHTESSSSTSATLVMIPERLYPQPDHPDENDECTSATLVMTSEIMCPNQIQIEHIRDVAHDPRACVHSHPELASSGPEVHVNNEFDDWDGWEMVLTQDREWWM